MQKLALRVRCEKLSDAEVSASQSIRCTYMYVVTGFRSLVNGFKRLKTPFEYIFVLLGNVTGIF